MARTIEKENEDEEIVMVGDGADTSDEEEQEEKPAKKKKDKEESEDDEDEEEEASAKGDDEDERAGHGDEDDEDKSEHRMSRKERRAMQREAKNRNKTEIRFLRSRNADLERRLNNVEGRQVQHESNSIDQRIQSIRSQLKVADQVLAKAKEDGTGEDFTEALNIRDRLKENERKLVGYKSEMEARAAEQENEPPANSPFLRHANSWMSRNDWYDPEGQDKDSRAVRAIDARILAEGYDPNDPEYWEELTKRVRRRLPHQFKSSSRRAVDGDGFDDEDESDERKPARRNGGPRFSTGGRERPLRKNEVYVSAERRKAMEDAGVWDDPKLRSRYLKRYQQYDREEAARGRR